MSKRILILGAGYAGIEAASRLNKKFRKDPEVHIDLINDRDEHILLTELHEVAGNRVDKSGVEVSIEQVFENTKVNIIKDRITGFDLENNQISSENQVYNYDHLVLGIGSEPTYYNIPGMEHNSFTLWSEEDAITLTLVFSKSWSKEISTPLLPTLFPATSCNSVSKICSSRSLIKLICTSGSLRNFLFKFLAASIPAYPAPSITILLLI